MNKEFDNIFVSSQLIIKIYRIPDHSSATRNLMASTENGGTSFLPNVSTHLPECSA